MNYYPHHIGDYLRDTVHLSALEDGTYRRMLDLYYASEKALPKDFSWLCKLVRAHEDKEREAVHEILHQFFYETEAGWRNKRADTEIKLSHQRSKVAKQNGKKGGRPRKLQVISGLAKQNPNESSQNQNQNQNQINKSIVGLKPDVTHRAALVLTYLNEQAGRDYRPVNGNLSFIAARLLEGAGVEDCKAVIDRKCREWKGGEMEKYLRPATLFNATKFAQYQGEKPAVGVVKVDV